MKREYDNLVVFHSVKEDGNMMIHYSNRDSYVANVTRFMDKNNIDLKKCLYFKPFGKDVVLNLSSNFVEDGPKANPRVIEADAVICQFRDVNLYSMFADALPFILFDQKQLIFAIAHLGWESIYLGLHEKIALIMMKDYHCELDDFILIIGPSIRKESYSVDDPVQLSDPKWFDFITEKQGIYYVDLLGYVLHYFEDLGFLNEQIYVSDVDTYVDKRYFSYHLRKEHDDKFCQAFIYGAGIVGE